MPRIVTFTGGLGAQILSAAGYLYLQKINEKQNGTEIIGSYLGYFNNNYHLATPGVKGDISHWKWELGCYGMEMSDFKEIQGDKADYLWDGFEKINFGFLGLKDPEIAKYFPVGIDILKYRESLFGSQSYACLHIRRGDYVNVASYVVSDKSFFRVVKKIGKFVKNLLVVSDSPLSIEMVDSLQSLSINTIVAVGGEPHFTHGLMRLSDILICSNSQYSMTAAALRDEFSLTLYPSQHDGDEFSYSNIFLKSIREFQLIA